jgi:hypothetical protein
LAEQQRTSAEQQNASIDTLCARLQEQQNASIDTLCERLQEQQESFIRQLNESIAMLIAGNRRASLTPSPPNRDDELPPPANGRRSPTRGFTPGLTPLPDVSPLPPITPRTDQSSTGPSIRFRSQTRETTIPPNDSASTTHQSGTGSNGRVPGIKIPKFRGKDGENVMAWLHTVKQFFQLNGTSEDNKVATASSGLRGDAKSFFYYLVVNNNYKDPPWQFFEEKFIAKYENAAARADLLRDKLQNVRYHGVSKMPEYCEEFRFIESQIYDMAFADRLLNFSKLIPVELALHIRNSDLRSKDMDN